MLRDDNAAAADRSAPLVPRAAAQFYDAERLVGRAIAAALGADGERSRGTCISPTVRDARWDAAGALRPLAFAHQLQGSWADQTRCFTGEALRDELRLMVAAVV